jgi:hypothetical protein
VLLERGSRQLGSRTIPGTDASASEIYQYLIDVMATGLRQVDQAMAAEHAYRRDQSSGRSNQEHLLITYQARVNHDVGTAAAVVTTTASFLHSSGYFRRHNGVGTHFIFRAKDKGN